jgi:hypothetical protein
MSVTRPPEGRASWWHWLLLIALTGGFYGCGDSKPSKPSGETEGPLVITRQSGAQVPIPANAQTYVWCGPWEAGDLETPALHVWVGLSAEQPGWQLRAVLRDVHLGDTLSFPNSFISDQPDSADIFLIDPPNELSTQAEDASGFIVFHRVPCPNDGVVEFSIDAVLGSEYGGMPTVSMRGRFVAQTTGAPPSTASGTATSPSAGILQPRTSVAFHRRGTPPAQPPDLDTVLASHSSD